MSGPVGNQPPAPNTALQQAEQTDLRAFLPADLASARGKELHIDSAFVSDRDIRSIRHERGGGLETVTIVTDEETVTLAETIANGQYGVRVTIDDDGDRDTYNMSANVVQGNLALVNQGSGSLQRMEIRPGFASIHLGTSAGAVTATLRAP